MNRITKTMVISLLLILFAPMAKLSAQVSVWDGTWEPWTHGTGTEADPFLIENAQQLAYLAYRVNNGLDAGGGHVSPNYCYKLMINVNLNGSENFQWTPIGYWNSYYDYQCFGGHFDGNGHTISGLYINNTANRVGFFGYTDGASVEDLGINAQTITTTGLNTTGTYAGGIIAVANNTIIVDCFNSGNVIVNGNGHVYSGGIVGLCSGSSSISDCYHAGSVLAHSSGAFSRYSGGIVGITDSDSFSITNCYNTGNVTTSSGNGYGYNNSGGIMGAGKGSFFNCYNTGNVISDRYDGGIVGQATGGIICTNCYNTGNISNNAGGGIVGYGSSNISNCYYLSTCGGNNTYGGLPLSADAMQTEEFVNMLNNNTNVWTLDTYQVNQGYPILSVMLYVITTTNDATDITQSHATLNGIVSSNATITAKGFQYKKTTESNYQTINVSGNGNISQTISNLIPNIQYQFRAFCTLNDYGTSYGEIKTFITQQINVATNNASEITQAHATLNGNLNVGDANISSQGFQYKKTSDSEYQTVEVSGSGDISTTLSDLTPNTQYRFRAFCTPQGCDPVYGQEKTFNTLAIYVTTNNATDVTQTHATLNGNLNVGDTNVSSQGFQYKRTSDSEYQTIEVSGSGSISTTLSDLMPNTQYRFRAFCTPQDCATVYGQEVTFNTLSINVTTNNATEITQTHATLNGNLNVGDASITSQGFQYKRTTDSEYQTIEVSGNGSISTTLFDLIPNTQYRFRAFCTPQDCATVYGQEMTFNTLTINVTTYPASNITESSATLNGYIEAGDAEVTDKGFKYWPAYEPQNVCTVSVSTIGNISATINNLAQNTYQYRAFAASDGNIYQGGIQEFEISWLNNDTIFVYDTDMLHWVAEQCNNGVTFEGKCVKLMNDIELPFNVPNNMISIGSYPNYPFKGTFDGNGKLITNLYIDQPNTPYQGFFGYTLNAYLYNVGLVNITASGRNYTGGMVAYAKNTYMRDCYVNGGTLFALSYCGGLVGYQEQGTNSIISGCYNTCEVTGNNYVGGLIGFSNYSTVRNSYVAGRVAAQGEPVGAIIGGANEVLMYYCYFSIDLTGQTVAIGENNFKDGEGLTSEQMRDPQFVNTLNQGLVTPVWKADYEIPINNGFPIIMWQEGGTTGIEENNADKSIISLYPNPANNFVTVQSDEPSLSLQQVEIYDISGRKVMSETLDGQSQKLSTAKLVSGFYLVRVQTSNGCYTHLKLVIE